MIYIIRRRTSAAYRSAREVCMRTYRSVRTSTPAWDRLNASVLEAAMMAFRAPVELALTTGLRRAARLKPGDFERLGEHRSAAYMIAPDDLPVAFRIEPGERRVRVVRRTDPGMCAVRIHGPLAELLGLFEGSLDADSAFFSRSLRVEGDTRAVVALHNALEAADLTLADMIGVPFGGALAGAALRAALRRPRRPVPASA